MIKIKLIDDCDSTIVLYEKWFAGNKRRKIALKNNPLHAKHEVTVLKFIVQFFNPNENGNRS